MPKASFSKVHFPRQHSFTITAPGLSFGVKLFKISKSQIVVVFVALFTGKLVALRPRFHVYIVSVQ